MEEGMFAKVHYKDAVDKLTHDDFVKTALAVQAVDDGTMTFKQWLVDHIKVKGSDMNDAEVRKGVKLP